MLIWAFRTATASRRWVRRDLYPAVAIVVLSASKDRDSVTKALDLGALAEIGLSGPSW